MNTPWNGFPIDEPIKKRSNDFDSSDLFKGQPSKHSVLVRVFFFLFLQFRSTKKFEQKLCVNVWSSAASGDRNDVIRLILIIRLEWVWWDSKLWGEIKCCPFLMRRKCWNFPFYGSTYDRNQYNLYSTVKVTNTSLITCSLFDLVLFFSY